MNITPGNNERLFAKLNGMSAEITKAKRMALFLAGTEMQRKAVELAPVKTGDLWRSITPDPQSFSGIKSQIAVGTNKVYGRIHDKGGIIKPKNKKFLAWQNPQGRWHFAKQVTIPKYKGRGYLTPAFAYIRRAFPKIMQEELSAVLKK